MAHKGVGRWWGPNTWFRDDLSEDSRFPEPLPDFVRGVRYQLERCPKTSRLHWQFVLQCTKNVRMSMLKKHYGKEIHWELTSSIQGAAMYCEKSQTRVAGPWELGAFVTDGARNDIMAVKQAIDRGATEREVAENFFQVWCSNRQSLNYYRMLVRPNRDWMTEVHVIIGDAGSGKSRLAFMQCPYAYFKPSGIWWDIRGRLDGGDTFERVTT